MPNRRVQQREAKNQLVLSRRPLREDIYQALLERLLSGELAPGTHINEQELCDSLGVSRTPLREALIQLEQDGFLRSDMARGFAVKELSPKEILEIYPIMAILESLGVELSGEQALREAVPDLERIVADMEAVHPDGFARAEELDIEWHARMRTGYENERLKDMVDLLRRLIRRYDYAYMSDMSNRAHSIEQHREMIAAIEDGDVARAAKLIRDHWRFSMEQDLARLAGQGGYGQRPADGR